jgi:hypothetical protein
MDNEEIIQELAENVVNVTKVKEENEVYFYVGFRKHFCINGPTLEFLQDVYGDITSLFHVSDDKEYCVLTFKKEHDV